MNRESALPQRIWAWSIERFPPVAIFSAFLLYAVAASQINYELNGGFYWSLTDWLGGLALTCHFLLLRVLDEHKDYKQDLIVHPNRMLQKGLITLNHLKMIGLFAVLVSLLVTLAFAEGPAVLAWAVMMLWTAMMTVEFFVPKWLGSHLVVYSASHMLVLPLMIVWALYLAAGTLPATETLLLLLAVVFINGLIYEILRKVKAPSDEIDGYDSYSKIYGLNSSVLMATGLHLASVAAYLTLIYHLFGEFSNLSWVPVAMFILVLLCVYSALREKNKKKLKALEGASALYVLSLYSILIYMTLA